MYAGLAAVGRRGGVYAPRRSAAPGGRHLLGRAA